MCMYVYISLYGFVGSPPKKLGSLCRQPLGVSRAPNQHFEKYKGVCFGGVHILVFPLEVDLVV